MSNRTMSVISDNNDLSGNDFRLNQYKSIDNQEIPTPHTTYRVPDNQMSISPIDVRYVIIACFAVYYLMCFSSCQQNNNNDIVKIVTK